MPLRHRWAFTWVILFNPVSSSVSGNVLPIWLRGKESARDVGDWGLILGSGRSPGEGNSYPFQFSCLENSMDRGAWQGYISPWGCKESDTTDWLTLSLFTFTWVWLSQAQVRQLFSGKTGYEVGVFSTTLCSRKKQGGPGLHRAQTWSHAKKEAAALCARRRSSPPELFPMM